MFYSTRYSSPIGPVLVASDGDNLVGLWLEGQKYFGGTVAEERVPKDDLSVFSVVREWLDEYFAGGKPDIARLPLAPRGSSFRRAVWALLCEIPYGTTTTYGEIARIVAAQTGRTGKASMSGQAVGGAVGHNPISIVIPCHRVVGANGSLTGYAGGLEKKIRLLELEGADMARFYVPTKGTAL
ncbi:methylated-DNA--[protein]-cysteine S-methyltransferase [Nitratidesulfovibrio liaohensis]|uniref:methylated-DNA--[protein]-cysteine S-methyltransferase n=1 Tax=Nitratidesulfovibrio liaohensis TaxID=2604158 RepID=UPI0014224842|nr:methylated-DNA--[protein]-cysteine S-methyltransferase [Nitratidesulfovibrio liaohensis]NHZ46440.1 methylated-DNA--[protein]-cysteine S-methyltransferase [Nitratidesulfovibrio liaohensis]